MRRRVFLRDVDRMRAGEPGHWSMPPAYDKAVVKRLMGRVSYGGRKGHRAFLRLWEMGCRPRSMRVTFLIKGFEMTEAQVAQYREAQGYL